ncbi:hypothetical protein G6F24_017359 [Rhizopus arrhizus]|nr:hypothetical protein G6F24_017359 [Rhizopus arrhizus]
MPALAPVMRAILLFRRMVAVSVVKVPPRCRAFGPPTLRFRASSIGAGNGVSAEPAHARIWSWTAPPLPPSMPSSNGSAATCRPASTNPRCRNWPALPAAARRACIACSSRRPG